MTRLSKIIEFIIQRLKDGWRKCRFNRPDYVLVRAKTDATPGVARGGDPIRPYDNYRHPAFRRHFFYTLLVLLGVFSLPAALVQSAPIIFTQSDWTTEVPGSIATEPFAGWNEFSTKNTGVVTTTNVSLQSVNYTLIQTSDDGAADTCVATGCSTGSGFNAGTLMNTTVNGTSAAAAIELTKIASDGSLVPNFGPGGFVRSDAGTGTELEEVNAIAVDSNYLYLAGYDSSLGADGQWRIEKRDKITGAPEAAFNDGGPGLAISNPSASADEIHAIAIDSNYIYAAGYEQSQGAGDSQWRIEKRNITTGAYEAAFSDGGVGLAISNASVGSDVINAIAIDATHVYAAGYDSAPGDSQWRIEKRNITTGALETAFNTTGIIQSNISSGDDRITAIAVDATHLYIAGYDSAPGVTNEQWRIEKRNIVTGALETAFNTTGIIQNDLSSGTDKIKALAINATHLFVAGMDNSQANGQWRIEKRIIGSGALDLGFDTDGIVENDPSAGIDFISGIAVNSRYIYAAGYDDSTGFGQWRIENRDITDGSLVMAFDSDGIVESNPSGDQDGVNALALDNRYLFAAGFDGGASNPRWLIEKRRATEFVTSGTFESPVIDLGGIQDFNIIRWIPAGQITGTSLNMDVQASVDNVTWGSWTAVTTDVDSGTTFDGNRYLRYRATLSTGNPFITPRMDQFELDFSNFPVGAGMISSVFDTGSKGNFLKTISWSETVDVLTDIRLQIATSADNVSWNYCGSDICSTSGWLSWNNANNYYDSGNLTHLESSDAVDDQYFRYQIWLTSDGTTSPSVDDIITTYDTASLEVFAPDGTSSNYTATAGTPFNIVIRATDTDGVDVVDHGAVGTVNIRLTASTAQLDVGACVSSFNSNGNTEFTQSALMFASGVVTIPNVTLCNNTSTSFTISAEETAGGELVSTSDLTITAVNLATGTQLLFTTQPPTTALATVDFIPNPVVTITDLLSNPITTDTTPVTLSAWEDGLCSTTAASGIFNVTSLGTTSGVATYSNVNYNTPENIFIRASASGFTSICSNVVAIVGTGYVVQIDPIYDVQADALVIASSLLRNGTLITDNANMTLTDVDILDSSSSSVSGGINGPDVSTITDAVNSIYHTTWAPSAGLIPDSVYSIFSDITYNGVLYQGNVSVNVNQLGVITADLQSLDLKVDDVQTTVSNIDTKAKAVVTSVASLDTKVSAHAASQAAYRAQTTASLDAIVKNIGTILEDTSKTVPDLVKSSISKELAKGTVAEIITTQSTVTTGAKIPFRYRSKTGLNPTVSVFDPKNATKIGFAPMREVGGTGIYVYDITFKTVWGLGNFRVHVNESSKSADDHIVLNVIKSSTSTNTSTGTAASTSAVTLDTLYSRLNKIDSSMDTLSSGVDTVKSNTETVSTDINELLKSVDGTGSSTATVPAEDVQKFGKYISSVSSVIGTSGSGSNDTETIMGKLKNIENSLDDMGIEATAARDFNQSARAKAERIKRFVTVIMTELKEEGAVEDAGEKAEILDDYLTELKSTVEEIPEAVTTGSIAESVESTLSELNEITVDKEGLEGLAPLVEQNLSEQTLNVKKVEDVSEGDMMEMRNDVSGLKSLMIEIRGLLDNEVNQPVVHGWLEGE